MQFTRSDPQRVDLYNRMSMYVLVLIEPLVAVSLVGNIAVETPSYVLAILVALFIVHGAACFVLLRASLRHRLADGPQPDLQRIVAGVITVVGIVLVQVWRDYLVLPTTDTPFLGYFAVLALLFFYGGTLSAGLTARAGRWLALAGFVTLVSVSLLGGHVPDSQPAVTAVIIWSVVAVFMASTFPTFVWISRVLFELDRSRQAETRLAIAEERLRFGRDLHDVLGRNLSVIALKSELATRVAHTDPDEAAEQMEEVRQVAESSLKEVRDVVRGYRSTDLDAELAGSRAVLEAAGVHCTITGSAAGLPAAVQSALAWVVREGTTNVLRHSDATSCELSLGRDGSAVMLTMENDGVRSAHRRSGGSGLIGLRERLEAAGGTLIAEVRPGRRYRLTAMVETSELE
jgi:two-component system, NarL family, sensor histidine kinase DesK